MKTFDIIMYILAAVCFLLSALGHYGLRRRTATSAELAGLWWGPFLVPLGLLFWVLVPLVTLIRA